MSYSVLFMVLAMPPKIATRTMRIRCIDRKIEEKKKKLSRWQEVFRRATVTRTPEEIVQRRRELFRRAMAIRQKRMAVEAGIAYTPEETIERRQQWHRQRVTRAILRATGEQSSGSIARGVEAVKRVVSAPPIDEKAVEHKRGKIVLWIGHGLQYKDTEPKYTVDLPIEDLSGVALHLSVNTKDETGPDVHASCYGFFLALPDNCVDGIILCYPPVDAYEFQEWADNAVRVLRPGGFISHHLFRSPRNPACVPRKKSIVAMVADRKGVRVL